MIELCVLLAGYLLEGVKCRGNDELQCCQIALLQGFQSAGFTCWVFDGTVKELGYAVLPLRVPRLGLQPARRRAFARRLSGRLCISTKCSATAALRRRQPARLRSSPIRITPLSFANPTKRKRKQPPHPKRRAAVAAVVAPPTIMQTPRRRISDNI